MISGKPKRIMHDNGKQFTSNMFKRFLEHNDIKDKPIPNSYPQLQGKIEAYIYVKASMAIILAYFLLLRPAC